MYGFEIQTHVSVHFYCNIMAKSVLFIIVGGEIGKPGNSHILLPITSNFLTCPDIDVEINIGILVFILPESCKFKKKNLLIFICYFIH